MKKAYTTTPRGVLYCGDCLEILREFPSGKARCCVTRPPRWRRKSDGDKIPLGRESSPREYVERLVEIFEEVFRVVSDDGTLWLNLRDSQSDGELLGIPWSAVFGLRSVGWKVLREIAVVKASGAREYLFLLAKGRDCYLDGQALREFGGKDKSAVWSLARLPRKESHFGAFPPDLVRPCLLAGSKAADFVLDPFFRLGVVGQAAGEHGRNWLGVELNKRLCQYVAEEVAVAPQCVFEDFG